MSQRLYETACNVACCPNPSPEYCCSVSFRDYVELQAEQFAHKIGLHCQKTVFGQIEDYHVLPFEPLAEKKKRKLLASINEYRAEHINSIWLSYGNYDYSTFFHDLWCSEYRKCGLRSRKDGNKIISEYYYDYGSPKDFGLSSHEKYPYPVWPTYNFETSSVELIHFKSPKSLSHQCGYLFDLLLIIK